MRPWFVIPLLLVGSVLLLAAAFAVAVPEARQLLLPSAGAPLASAADAPAVDHRGGRDRYGDPLPRAALMRLGTSRLRQRHGFRSVQFSPDRRYLASTGYDQRVTIWETESGRIHRRLSPLTGDLLAVAYSPDGQHVAAGDYSGRIVLWDVATRKLLSQLSGHHEPTVTTVHRMVAEQLQWERVPEYVGFVSALAFVPQSDFLLSGGGDGRMRLWSISAGRAKFDVKGHVGRINSLDVLPDGSLAVSAGQDGRLRLWQLPGGQRIRQFRNDQGSVDWARFSEDGQHLVACFVQSEHSPPATLYVWETESGRQVFRQPLEEFASCARVIDTPEGVRLVALIGLQVCCWSLPDGVPQTGCPRLPEPSAWPAEISADGQRLVACAQNAIETWDLAAGRRLDDRPAHRANVSEACWHAASNSVVSASRDGTLRAWDAATGACRWEVPIAGEIRCVVCPPEKSETLILSIRTSQEPAERQAWLSRIHLDKGTLIEQRSLPASHVQNGDLAENGVHVALIEKALIAKDEMPVTSVRVFRTDSLELVAEFDPPAPWIKELRFLNHGGRLLLRTTEAPEDEAAHYGPMDTPPSPEAIIYDLESRQTILSLRDQGNSGMALTDDGERLATVGEDGQIRLSILPTSRHVLTLARTPDFPSCIAFSPRADLLAVGGDDGHVSLCDVATGRLLRAVRGHQGSVTVLRFTPDGSRLVSGSSDSSLLVWSVSGLK